MTRLLSLCSAVNSVSLDLFDRHIPAAHGGEVPAEAFGAEKLLVLKREVDVAVVAVEGAWHGLHHQLRLLERRAVRHGGITVRQIVDLDPGELADLKGNLVDVLQLFLLTDAADHTQHRIHQTHFVHLTCGSPRCR